MTIPCTVRDDHGLCFGNARELPVVVTQTRVYALLNQFFRSALQTLAVFSEDGHRPRTHRAKLALVGRAGFWQ